MVSVPTGNVMVFVTLCQAFVVVAEINSPYSFTDVDQVSSFCNQLTTPSTVTLICCFNKFPDLVECIHAENVYVSPEVGVAP